MDYFNQETERLRFRKVTKEDIPTWITFFENNDNLHFLGIDISLSKEEHATNWIEKQLDRYETEGFGHLAVIEKESGTFIGMGGILPRELDGKSELEIAYSLIPAYWGKGYATELALQMKKFGYENQISDRFISIIHKANIGSINVAKKNGMAVLNETQFLGMEVFVFGIEK